MDDVLKGNENLKKAKKLIKHNSSNIFEKRDNLEKKEDEKDEDKKDENKNEINNINNPSINLLSDLIQDKSNNQPLLSDMISGNNNDNKEEDKKVMPNPLSKKKEMKRFKTDSILATKGEKEGMADRQNRMSKRLMRAKEQQKKKKEEESKFRKSENILKRASLLEAKLTPASMGEAKPIEKIPEEKEE